MKHLKTAIFIVLCILIVIFSILIYLLKTESSIVGYVYKYITEKPWTMTATIKEIRENKENTTLLVENIGKYGKVQYDFGITPITRLERDSKKINISDLKIGQKIKITAKGIILETAPAGIELVTKIEVIEE